MEKVACYIRVSSQEQKLHGISLEAQTDKLIVYAEKHNLKIVEWYKDEGVSGRKLIRQRPELQRMLNDAQEGKFDRILFIKLDRFFRSVAEYHECMKKIDPVIWTATEEKYDLSTANGRAFVNMKLTIAELEADQTGERIKIVNDYKVKNGQAITGHSALTFAFTTATIGGVKKVVKNKDNEAMVLDYINHFLTYHNKTQAYLYVRDKYPTKHTYTAFSNLLRDTHLYGHYRGNDNYNEPYITKAQYDKIHELLSKNIKHTASGNVYLFTGLIKCPECGRILASRNLPYNNHPLNVFYRCHNRIREKTCNFYKEVRETSVEEALLASFNDFVTQHIQVLKVDDKTEKIADTGRKITELKGELTRLNKMYQKNRITERQYDSNYDSITAKIKELENSASSEGRDLTPYYDLLSSDWVNIYHALNRENKRAFWRKYIREIHVDHIGNFTEVIFL